MQPCCTFQAFTVATGRTLLPSPVSISTSSPGSAGAGEAWVSFTFRAITRRSAASQGDLS